MTNVSHQQVLPKVSASRLRHMTAIGHYVVHVLIECDWKSLESIKKYSDEPTGDSVDQNLKCYMNCFYTALVDFEWSHEDDVIEWFTPEELQALLRMDEKCEELEFDESKDHCEQAYTITKCYKDADPMVSDD